MSVSTYIGRVGGLAVALGIGAAMCGAVGVADAAPGDQAAPADGPESVAGAGARPAPTTTTRLSHLRPSSNTASTPAVRGQLLARSVTDPPARRPADGRPSPAPDLRIRSAVALDSVGGTLIPAVAASKPSDARPILAASATSAAPVPPLGLVTSGLQEPITTALAVQPAAATASIPVMVPAAAAVGAQPGVVDSVLGPLFGVGPGMPVESPVSWVVLAVARRQAGVSGSAPTAAKAAAGNAAPVIATVVVGSPNTSSGAVVGTVTASDPNGDKTTFKATTSTKGKVTITSGGVFTYTPNSAARHAAAKVGATVATTTDTVTVTVTDSKGAKVTTTVTVPIAPKNSAPTATKTVGTPNTSTGVVTGTVKGSDPDKDALTYSGGTTGKGTVAVTTAGAFTYTPTDTARHAAAKIGAATADTTDTFTLTVSDGYGGAVALPVTVTIVPKNTAPVSATSTIGTPESASGVVTGVVRASDAEADPLIYSAPGTTAKGSVSIDASSGAFTYTPSASARSTAAGSSATAADKADSFTVTVADGYGGSVSIPVSVTISPSGAPGGSGTGGSGTGASGAGASGTGNAGNTVTFEFNYGAGSQYWTPESKAALETAAKTVAATIVASVPVTIVYDVTATNTTSRTLATASSNLTSSKAGFSPTVVQNKIQTGVDSNGSAADGTITVNFGMPWSFGDTVGASQYDFVSTTMHEIVHSMGLISFIGKSGSNSRTNWTTYDSFIMTSKKATVIKAGTYQFNTAYNSYLTGSSGGLYFGGPNAIAAYGGLVPLYTPSTWAAGSSINHLNDTVFTGPNAKLMNALVNTGPGTRQLSAVELGILKDLGYTVVPVQAGTTLLFVLVAVRRRRRTHQ